MTIQTAVGSGPDVPAKELDTRRILIVDDHLSFAELLSAALESVSGMSCVGTASTAAEAMVRADQFRPDIVIMDIQMPRQDGLLATRRIHEAFPDIIIVVVTAYRDPAWISRAASTPLLPCIWTEPAKQPHFVWARHGEVVIQITGNGPSGTTLVQSKE